jgi:hypothetical protein
MRKMAAAARNTARLPFPEQTVMTRDGRRPDAPVAPELRSRVLLFSERTRCYNQARRYHKSVTIRLARGLRGIQLPQCQLQCSHLSGDGLTLGHRRRCSALSNDRSTTDHPLDVTRRLAVLDSSARTSVIERPSHARPLCGPAHARHVRPASRTWSVEQLPTCWDH